MKTILILLSVFVISLVQAQSPEVIYRKSGKTYIMESKRYNEDVKSQERYLLTIRNVQKCEKTRYGYKLETGFRTFKVRYNIYTDRFEVVWRSKMGKTNYSSKKAGKLKYKVFSGRVLKESAHLYK